MFLICKVYQQPFYLMYPSKLRLYPAHWWLSPLMLGVMSSWKFDLFAKLVKLPPKYPDGVCYPQQYHFPPDLVCCVPFLCRSDRPVPLCAWSWLKLCETNEQKISHVGKMIFSLTRNKRETGPLWGLEWPPFTSTDDINYLWITLHKLRSWFLFCTPFERQDLNLPPPQQVCFKMGSRIYHSSQGAWGCIGSRCPEDR